MLVYNSLYRIEHYLVEKTNPVLGPVRRRLGKISPSFTIISNNCWAGNVYRWYNLPYLTPTVGLYFFPKDYNLLLSNLTYYCSLSPEFIPISESKYKEILINKGQRNVPIGRIDDVEIIFLHYSSFNEAKEKWQRRASRINWDNLILKNSEMNGCTLDDILDFDKLAYDKKFIFTTRDYGIDSQVIFGDYYLHDQIRDDTTLFNKYVCINDLLNNKPFKKRQISKYIIERTTLSK